MPEDTISVRATAFLKTIDERQSPKGTLSRRDTPPRERHEAFLQGLAELPNGTSSLHLGATLGQGGMGIVRAAIQRSVSREVAVKSLRPRSPAEQRAVPDPKSPDGLPEGSDRLLEEAWITGAIEHPNVVPIYDILRAEDGGPMIVMRRIAGRSWADALADKDAKAKLGEAWLESQLRLLIQVTHAISAAHAQGIVHRDLKPENVMLGQYGEVYVVDWGIAVLVDPSKHAHLPILAKDPSVVGTPCYMAPEMLAGEATRATDVYLLGAMAFEIATGTPPHDKKTMGEAVLSIMDSPPKMPENFDAGLRAILTKALAGDPSDRFDSAKAFADALEHYLLTRASVQTAHLGMQEVLALERSTRAGEATAGSVEALFGAARFSFQAAIRQWGDNEVAKEGLLRAYLAAGRFALGSGDPERALTIARDAPVALTGNDALPALEAEAARAVEARRAHLEALARHGDVESGTRTRSFVSLCVASMWLAANLVSWQHFRATGNAYPHELTYASLGQLVLWLGLSFWGRESLRKTEFNKKIVRAGFAIPLFLGALGVVLEIAGFSDIQVFQIGLIGCCGLLISIVIFIGEPLSYLAMFAFCLGAWAILLRPQWRYVGFLLALGMVIVASLGIILKSYLRAQTKDLEKK